MITNTIYQFEVIAFAPMWLIRLTNIRDWCFASRNKSVYPRPRASLFTSVCANIRFSGFWADQIITVRSRILHLFMWHKAGWMRFVSIEISCRYTFLFFCLCKVASHMVWQVKSISFRIYIFEHFYVMPCWNYCHVQQQKRERIMYKTI